MHVLSSFASVRCLEQNRQENAQYAEAHLAATKCVRRVRFHRRRTASQEVFANIFSAQRAKCIEAFTLQKH